MRNILAISILLSLFFHGVVPPGTALAATPDIQTLRSWVAEMKTSYRGPFGRLRWFCNDGTILPPDEDCEDHGGGIQHGQWSEKTRILRGAGYRIANVIADIEPADFVRQEDLIDVLGQILLERYLIRADEGWIYRESRYYRGSFQSQDEAEKGREILLKLSADPKWRDNHFPLLREAVRLLPHDQDVGPVTKMRELSREIAEKDAGFETIRIKIHVLPERSDAATVRNYARNKGKKGLTHDYAELARTIDAVFSVSDIAGEIRRVVEKIQAPKLKEVFARQMEMLETAQESLGQTAALNRVLASIRGALPGVESSDLALELLDLSLSLEEEVFKMGGEVVRAAQGKSRREVLEIAANGMTGIYGIGLISARQIREIFESIVAIEEKPEVDRYQREIDYLIRVSDWSEDTLHFYFSPAMKTLARIEPKAKNFIQDRLHESPVLFVAQILEPLAADARLLSGVEQTLFGKPVSTGLVPLNPGLARGVLRIPEEETDLSAFSPDGIYLLPATVRDLPRVAGILTEGEGNALSHVQLLARNLGIPNVAVARHLIKDIRAYEGQKVVLGVSPKGAVRLMPYGPQWDRIFEQQKEETEAALIRPDTEKLDLTRKRPITLSELRAADSGRIAGPKAANLGELKHYFPEAVAEGIAIPFGVYREMLDRPFDPADPNGPSIWEWMNGYYEERSSERAGFGEITGADEQFLAALHKRISNLSFDDETRALLKSEMARVFGPDKTYGVFVRSDTNVEDLPNFTGAGLNLTVPHVVGEDKILSQVPRVWASPFTRRAFQWRQARMSDPAHLYVSVLLMKSVPVDKSGVLVTTGLETGSREWLSIAVNQGPGGAVAGQNAEELRVHHKTGEIRLITQSAEPMRIVLKPDGGIGRKRAEGPEWLLTRDEIKSLIRFSQDAPKRFPMLKGDGRESIPADIEFGFLDHALVLFQIRPFLESPEARKNSYLIELDSAVTDNIFQPVALKKPPKK